jgi:hypothetical protein
MVSDAVCDRCDANERTTERHKGCAGPVGAGNGASSPRARTGPCSVVHRFVFQLAMCDLRLLNNERPCVRTLFPEHKFDLREGRALQPYFASVSAPAAAVPPSSVSGTCFPVRQTVSMFIHFLPVLIAATTSTSTTTNATTTQASSSASLFLSGEGSKDSSIESNDDNELASSRLRRWGKIRTHLLLDSFFFFGGIMQFYA